MKNSARLAAALLGCALASAQLSGCATNGVAQLPSTSQANLNSNAIQLAVGTARIGQDNTVGINVVATLRQPNGLSAVLANLPTLTGPSGFTVPSGMGGAYGTGNTDDGTAHISGSPQVPLNNTGLVNTTLGTFTGVFSYGFGPFNCDQNCTNVAAYYPGSPNASGGNGFESSAYFGGSSLIAQVSGFDPTQPMPFFAASPPFDYLVGPPAAPFFNNGTFPTGFAGYSPGFTVFELPPRSGGYSLSALVAAANTAQVTYKATANLNSTAPLGPITVTDFTPSGGGGTGHVTIPGGVTETEVFIVDASAGLYYTVRVSGTGAQAFTLPATLGPCVGSGCQTGSSPGASLTSGDTVFVSAVGYDYPAFEAGPPGNTQQKPAITGSNGQADITMSAVLQTTAP